MRHFLKVVPMLLLCTLLVIPAFASEKTQGNVEAAEKFDEQLEANKEPIQVHANVVPPAPQEIPRELSKLVDEFSSRETEDERAKFLSELDEDELDALAKFFTPTDLYITKSDSLSVSSVESKALSVTGYDGPCWVNNRTVTSWMVNHFGWTVWTFKMHVNWCSTGSKVMSTYHWHEATTATLFVFDGLTQDQLNCTPYPVPNAVSCHHVITGHFKFCPLSEYIGCTNHYYPTNQLTVQGNGGSY